MAKDIAVFTLTSALHDELSVERVSSGFLGGILPGGSYDFCGKDFSTFGQRPLDLIYVRTGGTEGLFLKLFPELVKRGVRKFNLLTSGKSNSLAASMEILSYLRLKGLDGEIIHGGNEAVSSRIGLLLKSGTARRSMEGMRLGVMGKPSDWLIASAADPEAVKAKLGIELLDIPMEEVKAAVDSAEAGNGLPFPLSAEILEKAGTKVAGAVPGAMKIHEGFRRIISSYSLEGFTVRCFDLLGSIGNTGCLSLALFNAMGIPAGCEGDVPALLSMTIAKAATGHTGFMANPSRIDTSTQEILFAHCTVPFDIVDSVELDTHFESGIGVGIRGHIPEGPVTVFKVSGDLSRAFIAEGTLTANQAEPGLCRTQIRVTLDTSPQEPAPAGYFLSHPIGNHHIIVPGRHRKLLENILK